MPSPPTTVAKPGSRASSARAISHLNALIPAPGRGNGLDRLYIAAEAGVVYRSDDGGETWGELPSPYAGSWFGGLALGENQVLLAGTEGASVPH